MQKSLLQSVLLHLVLITIFFSLPQSVDLLEKGTNQRKTIKLTVGPPNTSPDTIPFEEKNKPLRESTLISPKSKKIISKEAIEIPAKLQPNDMPSNPSMSTTQMQNSTYVAPEASPDIYGSLGLDSYYYNKPMEASPLLRTTKSPLKKLRQQSIANPFLHSNPVIPMQKIVTTQTEAIATIALSITIKRDIEYISIDAVDESNKKTHSTEQEYLQDVQQVIENHKIYPEEIKTQKGDVNSVKIKFRISKDGTITKIERIGSSSFEIFNTTAVDLLKKIGNFLPIPDALKKEFMDIVLAINYVS